MIEDWKIFDNCPTISIPPELTESTVERLIIEQLKIDSKCRHFILVLSPEDWFDYSALSLTHLGHIAPMICNKICDKIYFFRLTNSLFFNPEECCIIGEKEKQEFCLR